MRLASSSKLNSRERLGRFLLPATIGITIVFFLHRAIPSFVLGLINVGSLQNLVALWTIFAALLLLMRHRFPYPEGWGIVSSLGALWAIFTTISLSEPAALEGPFLAPLAAILASFLSFFAPVRGSELWLWLPALVYLAVVFGRTMLAGPLPGGFMGQYTGSIAFGQLMVVGFLLTYFFSERFLKHRNIIFAAGSVFIVGVMLSGSRGALVGLIVAVVLIVVGALVRTGRAATVREVKRFSFLVMFTVVPFFLPGIIVSGRDNPPVIVRKSAETFQLSEQVGSVQIPFYSSGRYQIWSSTLEQFETFVDVLVGKGQSTIQVGSSVVYPHNLFLELLLIGGLVTVVPFVLFLVFLFRKMFDPVYAGRFDFFVLAATTGVFSMFSGDLNYNIVFFFFLGLVYGQVLKHTGRAIVIRKSLPKEPL